MAFPLLAVIGAALSDGQSRQAQAQAIQQAGNASLQKILRTRAAELGGSPYGGMAEDHKAMLGDIERQANESRNNNIGNLLQAYLKSSPSAPQEKFGDAYESSFVHQPNLQYNPTDGLAMGDAMGKSQVDLWDEDPWGDAGF